MATEPTPGPDDAPDRHPDIADHAPEDDNLLPDDGVTDPDDADAAIDEAATEHAMSDELPDEGAEVTSSGGYAANAPADEAGGAVADAGGGDTPGSSQAGRGPLEGDPPEGTDQPVATDRVSDDEPLESEDPDTPDNEPIDGIDPVDDDTVDRVTDAGDDETAELSADVRAIGDVGDPRGLRRLVQRGRERHERDRCGGVGQRRR